MDKHECRSALRRRHTRLATPARLLAPPLAMRSIAGGGWEGGCWLLEGTSQVLTPPQRTGPTGRSAPRELPPATRKQRPVTPCKQGRELALASPPVGALQRNRTRTWRKPLEPPFACEGGLGGCERSECTELASTACVAWTFALLHPSPPFVVRVPFQPHRNRLLAMTPETIVRSFPNPAYGSPRPRAARSAGPARRPTAAPRRGRARAGAVRRWRGLGLAVRRCAGVGVHG